jgi:N-acetylglucosamine-6-phosphate deacetylase
MKVCGRLCTTGEVVTLSVADGRIASIRRGGEADAPGGDDVWLAAGFCDIQVNGYGGHDFNTMLWGAADEVSSDPEPILRQLAAAGVARCCPTFITNGHDALCTAMSQLARFLEAHPEWAGMVAGFHLEGPFIAPEDGPRGAHPLEHVRDPDWDEFQRLQAAAGGRIRLCTLAPERPGALPFIERLMADGVTVALGHTAAEPETIQDAVRAGARLSTHLGNGAHAQIRRHPNYIWEQLACDDLYASVIVDGHHLPAAVVKAFARVKGPERLAFVSDAVALGGLPPGRYAGGRYEVLPTGKIVTAGTPYLAGAGHLLNTCLANALRYTELSLAQVTACAAAIPARILGQEAHRGHLQVGYAADLTLFRVPSSGPLEIVATVCGGRLLYQQ